MFPVLRRIRQLEKKLVVTDNRLPPVNEVLSRFSAKLSDAQAFLHKAASTVQEASDKNRASVLKFQRNEVISHDPHALTECCSPLSSISPDSPFTVFIAVNS